MWTSCECKPEYTEETHLSELVTTKKFMTISAKAGYQTLVTAVTILLVPGGWIDNSNT